MTSEKPGQQLYERVDALFAERSLLNHPLYQTWHTGESVTKAATTA